MRLKKPLNFEQQIERLKEHGITIEDELKAKDVLKKVNYYRFTGYALQFRVDPQISEYKEGTTFNTIYNIVLFDEELRNVLRKYIEKIEIYFRTQISYGFSMAKCVESPFDQHYSRDNFYNKKGYDEIVDSVQHEKNYYRDSLFVAHHKKKYEGKMPLWVLVELMSFSNISKLYSAMYISEKETIANSLGISYKTLENHLHCLSVLRNKCAHAARLYNTKFNPPARFSSSFLRNNPEMKNNSLFAYVLVLLRRLPNKEDKEEMLNAVQQLLSKYKNDINMELIGFPRNYYDILSNGIK